MDTLCDIEGCTGFSCPDCGRCTAECPNMRCAREPAEDLADTAVS